MTIAEREVEDKGQEKGYMAQVLGDWVLAGILILSSALSFGLGWLAAKDFREGKDKVWIEQVPLETEVPAVEISESKESVIPPQPAAVAIPAGGNYVASKTGAKYYLPWCGTAGRIKDENKVWFSSKKEAEAAGYAPATNCKGL